MSVAPNPDDYSARDRECMARALATAATVRCATSPRPWVGCVVRSVDDELFAGATEEAPGRHAEVVALEAAGTASVGATAYVTLEPCCHQATVGACASALIDAGIDRVVVALIDPDERVSGRGVAMLEAAGVTVEVGLYADRAAAQLAPYLHQRLTGRPSVVLKLAATLDGGTAAPDGSSQWITCHESRVDGHRLRAESDAIIVGSGTVKRDDPSLTVRDYVPPVVRASGDVDPIRVILGAAPAGARVRPCRELTGDLGAILDELGAEGVLQVLIEGGASVAGDFHRAGLVDRYVIYLAPSLFGGGDARGIFTGQGAWTMADLWRGRFASVERVGTDVRIELVSVEAVASPGEA